MTPMGAAARQSPMTPEEYFRTEADAEERHEFHEGTAVAMAGGTYRHSLIALSRQVVGSRCWPTSRRALRIASSDLAAPRRP